MSLGLDPSPKVSTERTVGLGERLARHVEGGPKTLDISQTSRRSHLTRTHLYVSGAEALHTLVMRWVDL